MFGPGYSLAAIVLMAFTAEPPAREVQQAPFALVHDFGKVTRPTIPKHSFRIRNLSTPGTPLRIVSMRSGSSTLAHRWTKEVLLPGEEADIEVSLDTRRFSGRKTIALYVVTDNGTALTETIFYVSADAVDP